MPKNGSLFLDNSLNQIWIAALNNSRKIYCQNIKLWKIFMGLFVFINLRLKKTMQKIVFLLDLSFTTISLSIQVKI